MDRARVGGDDWRVAGGESSERAVVGEDRGSRRRDDVGDRIAALRGRGIVPPERGAFRSAVVETSRETIARLEKENAQLREENAQLRARLARAGGLSGAPA